MASPGSDNKTTRGCEEGGSLRWAIIKVETASLSMLTSWDSLARGKKIGLRSNLEEGLAGNIGVVICGLIVLVKPMLRLEIPVFLATSNRF